MLPDEEIFRWMRRDPKNAGEQYDLNHGIAKKSLNQEPEQTLAAAIMSLEPEHRMASTSDGECADVIRELTLTPPTGWPGNGLRRDTPFIAFTGKVKESGLAHHWERNSMDPMQFRKMNPKGQQRIPGEDTWEPRQCTRAPHRLRLHPQEPRSR